MIYDHTIRIVGQSSGCTRSDRIECKYIKAQCLWAGEKVNSAPSREYERRVSETHERHQATATTSATQEKRLALPVFLYSSGSRPDQDASGTLLNNWNKLDSRFCNPLPMKVLKWFAWWGIYVRSPSDPFPTLGVNKVFPVLQQRPLLQGYTGTIRNSTRSAKLKNFGGV